MYLRRPDPFSFREGCGYARLHLAFLTPRANNELGACYLINGAFSSVRAEAKGGPRHPAQFCCKCFTLCIHVNAHEVQICRLKVANYGEWSCKNSSSDHQHDQSSSSTWSLQVSV